MSTAPDTPALVRLATPLLGSCDQRLVDSQVMLSTATRALLYDQWAPSAANEVSTTSSGLARLLETLTAGMRPGLATATSLMRYVAGLVAHAWDGEDRRASEIVASGAATPFERARLLATLSRMSGIDARICLLYRSEEPRFHAVCELAVMGSWALFDPLANQNYLVTHHPYASAWDLMRRPSIADRHPEHGRKSTIDSSFYRTIGIVSAERAGRALQ